MIQRCSFRWPVGRRGQHPCRKLSLFFCRQTVRADDCLHHDLVSEKDLHFIKDHLIDELGTHGEGHQHALPQLHRLAVKCDAHIEHAFRVRGHANRVPTAECVGRHRHQQIVIGVRRRGLAVIRAVDQWRDGGGQERSTLPHRQAGKCEHIVWQLRRSTQRGGQGGLEEGQYVQMQGFDLVSGQIILCSRGIEGQRGIQKVQRPAQQHGALGRETQHVD
mmetsp:Transcript_34059/g.58505  ORF Transcript_34059/g.58505 Transcript_34059/m.58505 type:complete len:219 (+) Transcript_34059:2181-2837(+)